MNKLAAMNKAAALRSVARRSVLTKAAADWEQFAGPAAMALGGALGGSAVTGDDQSMLKRIGKGTLGAGLAYGGYKLMTDPKWQATARTGVEKATSLISQLVGQKKAAEAQDAYVAGFCKAAEAMGVDPVKLAAMGDELRDMAEQYIRANDKDYAVRGTVRYLQLADPGNLATGASLAGGAGLLGHALLPGKDKSTAGRVASGVAGTGLLAGGAYLAAKPEARKATREAIIRLVGRASEPFRSKGSLV